MRLRAGAARLLVAMALLAGGCASTMLTTQYPVLSVERTALLVSEISETSGLAAQGSQLWTHNDSGDRPRLYKISPEKGEVVQRRAVLDALNFDWEELAQDRDYLHIFDCGNNAGLREWMQVYSVRWDDLATDTEEAVPSRLTEFRFADAQPSAGVHEHNNDCEAATAVGDELWVFSKNWQDQQTRLYRLSADGERHALVSQAAYPVGGLITAADYDPDRQRLVLLGYTRNRFSSSAFIWLIPVVQNAPDWSNARRHPLSPAGQWEAVLWRPDGLVLTRESSLLGQSWLGFIPLP
ncbi:hypothetical protein [Marinobacterium sediminicola]|uniref:WD40 repeat protein n=1 Tax=Marinobacterium sediminicola TaxID=518898 RepID=A0ABY1S2M9_9GAMM|nr:hypothetical protein [Marinobacterium sediminicola]ULG70656.1 hypothetical protein LN244_07540 [Marinobacterium sediminicola]SMR77141.1 hypothetical protein SAMN04487964_11311 [Marinobacterium sediminicola]